MPNDQFKAPEAVWAVFADNSPTSFEATVDDYRPALEAALKQYNSELLGDEAVAKGGSAIIQNYAIGDITRFRRDARLGIAAAIDSVVKGGGRG